MTTEKNPIHQSAADGWHGVIQPDGEFPPEAGRYHLYIGLFCPFAHRVNLVRHLKGLQDIIDISVVRPYPKGDSTGWPGWKFPTSDDEYAGATVDRLFGSEYLHQVYFKADPDYEGRYSVPLLWDRKTNTAVNNESAEMLRWLPGAFNSLLSPEAAGIDLYPEHLRFQIDSITEWMQRDVNAGVYKAGFAQTQADYDKNVIPVFGALNRLEELVAENWGPFILGKEMTELDFRLYPTLIRFDPVYVQHFKCNLGTIRHDYPVLNHWLTYMYWNVPACKDSTDFTHIKENYTKSHADINPKAITPMGPFPHVESYVETDFSKLRVGGVTLPAVVDYQSQL